MQHCADVSVQPLDTDGVRCLRDDMGEALWLYWCGGTDGEIHAHLQRSWTRGIWWFSVSANGVYVGLVSIRNRTSHYEMAWMTIAEHRQQGYATAAVKEVLRQCSPHLTMPICATINDHNYGSINVAEANGFLPLTRDRRTVRYQLETPLEQ